MSGNRFPPYPQYVESGLDWLGDVPDSWQLRRLGAFFRERREKVSDQDFAPLSVTIQGIVPQLATAAKTDAGDNRKLVKQNDFVINSRSDRRGSAGISPLDGSVSLISIVLEPIELVPRYVHYLLRSQPFQEEFYRFGKGIVDDLWSTNYSDMKNIIIPVMTRTEQTQIANFLDHETAKIDALIEKQQQLIALLKEKRSCVISHAVTKGLNPDAPMKDSGVEWLGEVPAHWVIAKLGHRYEILLGKMLDASRISGDFLERYLRNTDVQWRGVNEDDLPEMDFLPGERERYSVRRGDLLVCEGGEVGRAAIWERDYPCFYQKALHRLRPSSPARDLPRFMYYHLFNAVVQERFVAGAGKATIAHLPAEAFRQYRFSYPPWAEQQTIACYLDERSELFDRLELLALEQIRALQERRTALISAAVTGKIDVRGWKAPKSASDEPSA